MDLRAPFSSLFLGGILGNSLLSQRSPLDAAQIAADPTRHHGGPAVGPVPYAAAVQLIANLGERLHEPLARLNFHSDRLRKAPPHSEILFQFARRMGLGTIDPFFLTHPLIDRLLSSWKLNNPSMGLQHLHRMAHDTPLYLLPTLRSVFEAMTRAGVAIDRETWELVAERLIVQEGGRRLDPQFFYGLNSRGIDGYDRHLFGFDPLGSHGFHIEPPEKALDRILDSLPQDAVVADWGAGAGIFAAEIRELRPDLRIYTADQFSPLEILPQILPGLSGKSLQDEASRYLHMLVGDALEIRLPDGVRADAIFSVALSPYVTDPLRLIAHLYNQLKPGGLLALTLTRFMHDVSKPHHHDQDVILDVTAELALQKVRYGFFRGHKTLIVQRADERRLSVTAIKTGSFYEPFELNLGKRKAELEHCLSFYRPSQRRGRRWVSLED